MTVNFEPFGPFTLSLLFQLKRLLGLTRCSMEYKKTKDETLFCDPWDKRTSEDRMIMIMIGLSLILQVFYGLEKFEIFNSASKLTILSLKSRKS